MAEHEIRCYGNQRVANGLVAVMAIYPLVFILVSLSNGRFLSVWWLPLLMFIGLGLIWVASRRGTFIVVDLNRKTLHASNFFIRTRSIPIESITHIGTRGMFVGAATEIEITYRKPDGRKKTIGYGTTNFLNPKDLKRVFDALLEINPSLRLPHELVEKLSRQTS
jgi:hypothetical protein